MEEVPGRSKQRPEREQRGKDEWRHTGHNPGDSAQRGLIRILEAGQIVPLAQVSRIRLHVRQRQLVDSELFVDFGRKASGLILPLSDRTRAMRLCPCPHGFLSKRYSAECAGILPSPVLGVAVALKNIHRHFVAELAAEIDEQRNGSQCEKRNMPRLVHIHARLIEAFDALLDAPAGLFDKGFAFRIDCGEIDQMAFGIRRIPGSDRFRDLRDGNGDRLSCNPCLELHNRRLLVRPETSDMEDPILMRFLVFLKDRTPGTGQDDRR